MDTAVETPEMRAKLDELAEVCKLYDSVYVHDMQTWYWRQEVEQRYMAIVEWLEVHGVRGDYDHEQKRFRVKPMLRKQEVEQQG